MTENGESEDAGSVRKIKSLPGIGLPAGTDYPNLAEIPETPCKEVFWRKEVADWFEIANNGYSFHRNRDLNAVFAKDLSGYWYRLNNQTKCFEFLFEGFKDTTDYTRISLPPQSPTFVGFNTLQQAVFPMNCDGKPILPKDDKGKTIFPFYDGYPLFPVDDSGAICVPLGDDEKPVFPRIPEEFGAYVPHFLDFLKEPRRASPDVFDGRVVLPLNELGEPIYPRDELGNVLMPFIILDDGTRRRAVFCAEDGTPILPFHNGEHALEVHEGEVLFQYEYQQKMMHLAQFSDKKTAQKPQELMDEQFYQQHYQSYQQSTISTANSTEIPSKIGQNSAKNPAKSTNLLLKQLTFMKKKQEAPSPSSSPLSAAIPAERPAKPNKEKERGDRFLPEPSRRFNRFNHRNRSPPSLSSRTSRHRSPERRRDRSRSRSLTYSPIDRKSRTNSDKYDKKRAKKSNRRDRSSSSSSGSTSPIRREKREKSRK
ncbi:uncharacterized protein CELE_Y39A3CL.7 [Caenorhabditis elegans]|uniref:Uncharacterized protein n=1 Tax=Caenorhabditis elegans TaxID=6239 RepID=Q965X1_CAEEL|nr:Uncharacterized protein CELE_Y39A3CL.7 [Caenorhabditis elegans]CCD73781.1 Uncharacterized protein CELE_Y39A3CL.7 [Caenorhabditis elegans]|eukprot:NP_001022845.2 Uncharacterized protein CELE_Y39A3CL.7 [Caenorhabditis elegans]